MPEYTEGEWPKLCIKVCEKCGRQVAPHVDHNLGTSRRVHCAHGRFRPLEEVGWEKIEVVPRSRLDAVVEALTSDEAIEAAKAALLADDGDSARDSARRAIEAALRAALPTEQPEEEKEWLRKPQ